MPGQTFDELLDVLAGRAEPTERAQMSQSELDNLVASLTGGEIVADTTAAVATGVQSVVKDTGAIGLVKETAGTLTDAVSDGISSGINQAGIGPSMTWPLVIGGVIIVAGLIGVGLYLNRGR